MDEWVGGWSLSNAVWKSHNKINDKDLLYSIGNDIQCLVLITCNGKESESLCCIYKTLWINYSSIHAKSWLIGKGSDAGRDWGQEENGMTEDEMAGWHHWLDGRESEWTPGVGDGQGGLVCCDSWGRRVRQDWATELNWTELITQHCKATILPGKKIN